MIRMELTGSAEQIPLAQVLRDTVLAYVATTAADPAEALFCPPKPGEAGQWTAEQRAQWTADTTIRSQNLATHVHAAASRLTDAAWWCDRVPRSDGLGMAITDRWLRSMVNELGKVRPEIADDVWERETQRLAGRLAAQTTDDEELRAEYQRIAAGEIVV